MRTSRPTVPASTELLVEVAFDQIGTAKAALVAARRHGDRTARRQAHADLRAAYEVADARLREVTTLLKQGGHHSYVEWSRWRARLSRLDLERQVHLFDETDDSAIRPLGSIRAIDTGMSGPAIGDLQHGDSVAPGTPARYGLDMEAVFYGRPENDDRVDAEPASTPAEPTVAEVIEFPAPVPTSPSAA
jgi:hypothetical protein